MFLLNRNGTLYMVFGGDLFVDTSGQELGDRTTWSGAQNPPFVDTFRRPPELSLILRPWSKAWEPSGIANKNLVSFAGGTLVLAEDALCGENLFLEGLWAASFAWGITVRWWVSVWVATVWWKLAVWGLWADMQKGKQSWLLHSCILAP